jgi:hypothetical protein
MESAAEDDDDSVGVDFQILHQSAAVGEDARQLIVSTFAFFTTESLRHGENFEPVKTGGRRFYPAVDFLGVSVTPW